jgi:hypothetical protein
MKTESTTTLGADGLNFPTRSRERQKDVRTLIVELVRVGGPRRDAESRHCWICVARINVCFEFQSLGFWICFEFRISCFGFLGTLGAWNYFTKKSLVYGKKSNARQSSEVHPTLIFSPFCIFIRPAALGTLTMKSSLPHTLMRVRRWSPR